jgi:hypothetical protein
MDIRFISSLTAEDESLFAPALLKAIGALLDQLPIAYTLRIETTGAQVFQHSHAGVEESARGEGIETAVNGRRGLAYARIPRISTGS